MENDPELLVEKDDRVVRMSMDMVYEALLNAGMLEEEQEKKKEKEDQEGQHYLYHKRSVGHPIQDCQEFLGLIQEMMDEGKIKFCKEVEGQAMNVL